MIAPVPVHCFSLTINTFYEPVAKILTPDKLAFITIPHLKMYSILTSLVLSPEVSCHEIKANPTGHQLSKYECFLISGCQVVDL